MNIKLLREIQQAILKEPEKFNMSDWHCGTAHCIGGWANVLTNTPIEDRLPCEILLLNDYEADELFYVTDWPQPFRSDYIQAKEGSPERAKIASDYIDYFIEKYQTK